MIRFKPVSGGLLLGGRELDLLECPCLGCGWLLLLTTDRRINPDIGLPLLSDGSMELLGIITNTGNACCAPAFCRTIREFRAIRFYAGLAIPHADK